APGPRRDRDTRRRTRGEPHLAVAEEGERAEVALAEAVHTHGLDARRHDRIPRERHREVEDVRRAVEPIDVLAEPEDRRAAVVTLVAPDALEDAETVVQRVGEDVHLR